MKQFEVGKVYFWYQREYDPFLVIARTEKTIKVVSTEWVRFGATWRMRIKTDRNGDEFVVDSSVPRRWRDALTSSVNDSDEENSGNVYALWKSQFK